MSLLKSLVLLSSGAISQVPAGDTTADWNNLANKPATFPPAIHSHVIADVTGLQTALDGKVAGPGSSVSGQPALFDGATGKLIRETTYATFKASLAITIPDVSGLQGALDAKLNVSAYTAADVLAKLLTVDGAGTGLDADLLDGQQGSYYLAWANFTGVPATFAPSAHSHVWADITGEPTTLAGYGITDAAPISHVGAGGTAHAAAVAGISAGFLSGADKSKLDGLTAGGESAAEILAKLVTVDGAGSGLDADLLDGQSGAYYLNIGNATGTLDPARIAADSLTYAKLQDPVGLSVIGNPTNVAANAQDITATATGQVLTRLAGSLVWDTLLTANYTDKSVTVAKMQDLAAVSVLGNPTGALGAMSAIAAGAGGQVLMRVGNTLAFSTLGTGSIGDGTITYAKMQDVAIVSVMGNPTTTPGPPVNIQAGGDGRVLQRSGGVLSFAAFNLTNAIGTLPDASLVGAYTGITALTMSGSLNIGGHVLAIAANVMNVRATTADGADTCVTHLSGGGNALNTRGAYISVYGNENGSMPGRVNIAVGQGVSSTVEITGNVNIAGNLTANNLAAPYLYASMAKDWPALGNNVNASQNVTVTGAAVNDVAIANQSNAPPGVFIEARVTGANNVVVHLQNQTGATLDLASGTLSVVVFPANPLALMAEARPGAETQPVEETLQ